MKLIKRLIYLILAIVLCVVFISSRYESQADPVEKDIETIKNIVNLFEDRLVEFGVDMDKINEVITKIEEHNKETKYIIVFDIQNDTNPILSTSLHLPVTKDFFDSVEIGDKVAEEEIKTIEDLVQLDKKLGSWAVVIKDKKMREHKEVN